MVDENVRTDAAKAAVKAYRETIGDHDGCLEVVIDLQTDLRDLLEREGARLENASSWLETRQRTEQRQRNNGWANRETSLVSLWLSGDDTAYQYWKGEAAKTLALVSRHPQVIAGVWTEARAARFSLADQLHEELEEAVPDCGSSVYTDLLMEFLASVHWVEIAESILNEYPGAGSVRSTLTNPRHSVSAKSRPRLGDKRTPASATTSP